MGNISAFASSRDEIAPPMVNSDISPISSRCIISFRGHITSTHARRTDISAIRPAQYFISRMHRGISFEIVGRNKLRNQLRTEVGRAAQRILQKQLKTQLCGLRNPPRPKKYYDQRWRIMVKPYSTSEE